MLRFSIKIVFKGMRRVLLDEGEYWHILSAMFKFVVRILYACNCGQLLSKWSLCVECSFSRIIQSYKGTLTLINPNANGLIGAEILSLSRVF